MRFVSKSYSVHEVFHSDIGVTHGEVGQRHEAHEVVPHTADVLQQLLQLL